jgi:Na+/H+-dicarboxylate symporter
MRLPGLPDLPLYVRVMLGVALGVMCGLLFGTGEIIAGATTEHFSQLGILVIRMLKMLAVPLVLFAILDAIARTDVSARMGFRLIVICLFNVSIAFTIGLVLMNTLHPGDAWQGRIAEITGLDGLEKLKQAPTGTTLSPLDNLAKWIPESIVQPFSENNVISVVLMSVLLGAALRKTIHTPATAEAGTAVAKLVEGGFHVLSQMLTWVVELVPFAVFGTVSFVVGKAGLDAFSALWGFLFTILLGFTLHAGGYYTLMAWLVGRKPPRVYLGKGANAILTGLSTNSSLATVPVTLACLDKMGVSKESARMSACIGTNLNNDGITLYEAMAALFLAQGLGYDLSIGAQLTIIAASMMAGIGIAGIPEAGLIVLPLVLHAVGLPEPVVAALIPVIFVVDWILARCRTVVNVMSDMLVAILLERWRGRDPEET